MDKTDVYKSLVEIGNAISLAETCIKHKYKLPDTLIARLNKLGDLGSDIEAYARATGDKDIIKEIDQLPRAALHQVNGWYAIEQQTRLSIALCNRSLYKVANMKSPQQIQDTGKRFDTDLNDVQLKTLFNELKQKEYIDPNTDENSFIWAFGGNGEVDNYVPIEWIKTVSTTHRKSISIRALLNLLSLIGVPKDQIRDNKIHKAVFSRNGKPHNPSNANYIDAAEKKFKSEYNDELEKMLTEIKA